MSIALHGLLTFKNDRFCFEIVGNWKSRLKRVFLIAYILPSVLGHSWPKKPSRPVTSPPPVVVKRIVIPEVFTVDSHCQSHSLPTSVEKRKPNVNNMKTKMTLPGKVTCGKNDHLSRLKLTNGIVTRNNCVRKPKFDIGSINGASRTLVQNGKAEAPISHNDSNFGNVVQVETVSSSRFSLLPSIPKTPTSRLAAKCRPSESVSNNRWTNRSLNNNKLDALVSRNVLHTKVSKGPQPQGIPPSFIKGLEDVYAKDGQHVTLTVQITGK